MTKSAREAALDQIAAAHMQNPLPSTDARRIGRMAITREAMAALLRVPEDHQITDVSLDTETWIIRVTLEGPEMPEHVPGRVPTYVLSPW